MKHAIDYDPVAVEKLYGDYDRSAYRENLSLYMIWRMRRGPF